MQTDVRELAKSLLDEVIDLMDDFSDLEREYHKLQDQFPPDFSKDDSIECARCGSTISCC